jgi:hypothetical protein
MIGNSHAVGVGAQITEHLLGSTKGWLAINHPIRLMELADRFCCKYPAAKEALEDRWSRYHAAMP